MAYERFRKHPLIRQRIEMVVSAYLHTAQEHATDVDLDRWENRERTGNALTVETACTRRRLEQWRQ
jgi:hypothetical protein